MSDEGRAYVIGNSPYRGVGYLIHYMMGDLANATHDYRLFMGDKAFAARCRVSTDTLSRYRATMIADGFLESLSATASRGHPLEYRFLMPKGPQVADLSEDEKGPQREEKGPQAAAERSATARSRLLLTEIELKRTEVVEEILLDRFDFFWNLYPRRNGKRLGRGLAEARWLKMSAEDREAALAGVVHYLAACDGGLTLAKDCERWLRGRHWEDWQDPAEKSSADPMRRGTPTVSQLRREALDSEAMG